ncbi:MAG: class I SAM-dependent methyltransferase, partial [bacterium]|nr:class I SAM-dependent methyltransferase [bacterium]
MPTNKEQKKEWFEGWFDENYLLLYSHRNRSDAKEQINLIIDTLKPPKEHSILDLACGEGRYTTLLHELGYHNITGLDLSQTLINSGKKKYPYLDLHVGDMRSIKGKYDLILSLFTAFGYFQSDEENENVLQGIYNSLKPDGTYWFDFLNAQQVEKDMVPR